MHYLDFKIIVDVKNGPPITIWLVAPSMQEKAAWITDISQCMDNVHFNDLLHCSLSDTSSVVMPQSIRNDPKLFKDDVDIRFSRTLNSCKVPQIRYATPERLLERLTDLRFLSIDFLNTFLLTYRVFTDGVTVLEALKKVFYNADLIDQAEPRPSVVSLDCVTTEHGASLLDIDRRSSYSPRRISTASSVSDCDRRRSFSPRRISTASSVSGYGSESDRDRSQSIDSQILLRNQQHWRWSYRKFEEEQRETGLHQIRESAVTQSVPEEEPTVVIVTPNTTTTAPNVSTTSHKSLPSTSPYPSSLASSHPPGSVTSSPRKSVTLLIEPPKEEEEKRGALAVPKPIAASSSADTLTDNTVSCPPSPPSSSATLVGSSQSSVSLQKPSQSTDTKLSPTSNSSSSSSASPKNSSTNRRPSSSSQSAEQISPEKVLLLPSSKSEDQEHKSESVKGEKTEKHKSGTKEKKTSPKSNKKAMKGNCLRTQRSSSVTSASDLESDEPPDTPVEKTCPSPARSASIATQSFQGVQGYSGRLSADKRYSTDTERSSIFTTPRSSFQHPDSPQHSSRAGVVVTSSRQSRRRSSNATASAAFAIATAGSGNPRDLLMFQSPAGSRCGSTQYSGDVMTNNKERLKRRESVMSTAATMRVLNVLRHWVSKHSQDFDTDQRLKNLTIEFLEDILCSPQLLPAEHKAASQLLKLITREEPTTNKVDLDLLLAVPMTPSKESIETLSALEIAEQMTFVDHQIFVAIRSEEFLSTAWMKPDKAIRAPHIILLTKRFNEVSLLVVSEIVRRSQLQARIASIEKWAAVADICRCLHNFNGVLQVCAAFTNSSVFRLKKTWEKVSKTTKQTIDKLQTIVSSDGRFRNLRDALHRCDPPCIPYLGMYLTDLSFIEEGTPNFTEDKLLNFSKMRMIAHVIREIRHFQQTPYKIEISVKVSNYLLDHLLLLDDDELYRLSLEIEPRSSRLASTQMNQPPAFPSPPSHSQTQS